MSADASLVLRLYALLNGAKLSAPQIPGNSRSAAATSATHMPSNSEQHKHLGHGASSANQLTHDQQARSKKAKAESNK